MNKNLQSPTKLTEFAPLSPEPEESPGITYLITKLFKRGSNTCAEAKQGQPSDGALTPECLAASDNRWPDNSEYKEPHSDSSSQSGSSVSVVTAKGGEPYRLEVSEGRSLPSVLKRISNLLALKSSGLQAYKDTELKQYWMPDSVSKECYDCGEKFTTFRRKHHCRVCGQIFCSRCCNQEIPGKIMGCTGDLRVCTYCGKVVLSYLQSADMGADLSSDLRALQEDLQVKFGGAEGLLPSLTSSQASLSVPAAELDDSAKRKTSVGYQEERFIQARQYGREERSSLQSLVCDLSQASTGLGSGVFTASQLVDWLMLQNRASYRSQGVAIGQTLLETNYLESVGQELGKFLDNNVLFRLRLPARVSPPTSSDELWSADLPLDSTTTDSEGECPVSEASLPTSSSLFRLDLNLEDSTVHISRPPPTATQPPSTRRPRTSTSVVVEKEKDVGDPVVQAMVQSYRECSREPAKIVNWHTTPAHSLRADNGERQAYQALREGFQQHLSGLVKQLLNSEGLAQSWAETVLPLAERVVDTVQPNTRSATDDMDIRQKNRH